MLKQFSIKNFKCYGKKEATFDLSRITFIYGNNSVGKSSFLDALAIIDLALRNNQGMVCRSDGFKNGEITANDKWNLKCVGENGVEESLTLSLNDANNWILTDDANGDPVMEQVFNQSVPKVTHVRAGDNRKSSAKGFEALAAQMEESEGGLLTQEQVEDVNKMFENLDVHYRCAVDGTLTDLDFDMPNLEVEKVGTGIRGIYRYLVAISKWKTGLLLLEEPEANVNESQLQKLTQVLVGAALKRCAESPNAQMVVECHSELMFLALRNMLAHGELKPADVAINVITKFSEGSESRVIPLDEFGNILQPWPGGFFPARTKINDAYYDEERE